jgi:NAD(P)-dependent dehydrogenase (short-subunit alcohol dehydrogenase family)
MELGAGLEDRGVLVTGAAGGVGRAVATRMAEAGARVCAVDIDAEALAETVASLPGGTERHLARPFDLADTAAIAPLVESAVSALGGLFALVHAAALLQREPIADVTVESFDRQVDVNLKATFFLDRAAGEAMTAGGAGGRIVNFSSAAWLTGPMHGSDVYVATKSGIVSLTRGFAKTLGRQGITVNVIAPGQIDTPMQHRDNDPEVIAAAIRNCPLGRMGTPDEVARVALFLASEHAGFISGATITVAGGAVLY